MISRMLTTVDNPFNPFTQYDQWWSWDNMHGYHCPERLAKKTSVSNDMPDIDQDEMTLKAIRDIVANDASMMYTIAYEDEEAAIKEIEEMYGENDIVNDE